MNEQEERMAHKVLILIGVGLFVAGIITRTYSISPIGIVLVGANLRGLARERTQNASL